MSTIRRFYEILGLSPFASRREIVAAIARLRQKDKEGQYAATLDEIEKTLLPQKKARAETESAQTLVQESRKDDHSAPSVKPEKPTKQVKKRHRPDSAPVSLPTERVADQSASSYQNQDNEDSGATRRKKSALLAAGVLIVAIAAVIAAKLFIYDALKSRDEARKAVAALVEAKDRIEAYIRQYKTFPTEFSFNVPDAAPYGLSLQNKQILATFNQNATARLQNQQIALTALEQPDVNLIWQCDVLPGFPESYRPDNCY